MNGLAISLHSFIHHTGHDVSGHSMLPHSRFYSSLKVILLILFVDIDREKCKSQKKSHLLKSSGIYFDHDEAMIIILQLTPFGNEVFSRILF